MTDAIEFRDVHRRFGSEAVLRGLSFTVPKGQIYAFLGRNGTGKTTALRVLMGHLQPHRGESFLLGHESRSFPVAERERIGYVTEGHRMYQTLTIHRTLAFEAGTRPQFDLSYAREATGALGLGPNKIVGLLSRGQRAQLALILAIAGHPEVLVFDDPALGLDVVMRRDFLDAMIDFLADRGTTVLLSSHILTDVERVADRIGILQGGRMLVDADLDDLKARVRKCGWQGSTGTTPPAHQNILRSVRRRDGFDLTLLDPDEDLWTLLGTGGAQLSDPIPVSLEDLFLDLTVDPERRSILPPRQTTTGTDANFQEEKSCPR